jgi:hypothetical protein
LADDSLVEFAPYRVVDGLDGRLAEAQLGFLEQAAESLVLACKAFGVDQQAKAFVEGQLLVFGILVLFRPRRREGVEAQGTQFIEGRFNEHRAFSFSCSSSDLGHFRAWPLATLSQL